MNVRVMLQFNFSMPYPVQHPEEKSSLFFPDHSLMTSEPVQPIGSRSSHWAGSRAFNWLEKIKISPLKLFLPPSFFSDSTASQKMCAALTVDGISSLCPQDGENSRLIKHSSLILSVMCRTYNYHSSFLVSLKWNHYFLPLYWSQSPFSSGVWMGQQVLSICWMFVGKMLPSLEAHPVGENWNNLLWFKTTFNQCNPV